MAREGRFSEIRSLPQDVQTEIDNRLNNSIPAREIVIWLQDEGHLTDKNPASLKKMLERYKGSDLLDKNRALVLDATKGMSAPVLAKKLNAMTELNDLCVIQRARVDKMLLTEGKNDALVLKQTSEEIKLLKENLVALGNLQLETGALRRAPKTVSGTMVTEDGQATTFEWTEENAKLFSILDGLDPNLVIEHDPSQR
ncbi:hypothetical protein EVB27_127 [Rhizobium phage RHph_TM16]|nr:hypothetical protein EVB27_127 [Rhizobium phage RHph_TM16]